MKRWLKSFSELVKKYPHRFSTLFFGSGFLWDFLTLWRADGWYENTWFAAYLVLTMCFIIALARTDDTHAHPTRGVFIALLQFSFGSLAGGLLVLYGRSGTLAGSALFLLLGTAIVLANDLWGMKRYAEQTMRIGVWYALLLAYLSMTFPVIYGRIGDDVFVHGIITGFIIAFVLVVAFRVIGYLARPKDLFVPLSVLMLITALFVFAHFTGTMPAVPLALRTAGIVHDVAHEGTAYTLTYEEPRIPLLVETAHVFHGIPPVRLYCFTQLYVPSSIKTAIQHRWEWFDPTAQSWKQLTIIPFLVAGGRDEGYRGYTYITARNLGDYRCNIETDRQVLIGRRSVEVRTGVPVLKQATF
jgi:hypothetical protein